MTDSAKYVGSFWRKGCVLSETVLHYSILKFENAQNESAGHQSLEEDKMKHIRTINKANLSATAKKGGCGKCQASCQSACKTSCTVGNQKCANEENK